MHRNRIDVDTYHAREREEHREQRSTEKAIEKRMDARILIKNENETNNWSLFNDEQSRGIPLVHVPVRYEATIHVMLAVHRRNVRLRPNKYLNAE